VLDDITPVILTYDEGPNIGRCLERLAWARDIVVVDSASSDDTAAICTGNPRVRLFTRAFDNHANQWNYAIGETGIASRWILALDADYMLTEAVVEELAALRPPGAVAGYWLPFRYAVMGKVLRSGIYPPVLALFRNGAGRYVQDGHTQRADVGAAATARLTQPAIHDDQKPFGRWVRSQLAYAELEAEKLERDRSGFKGWLRSRTPLAAPAMAAYCLIWRGAWLEGAPGWLYAAQRTIAEAMISAAVLDRRLRRR
jgi:glycosyltransferase involved in cell wall biosynthesis